MVVQNQSQLGEGSTIPTDPHHTPTIIQPSTQPQKTQQPRKPKRKDTQVPQSSDPIENVADEAIYKELGDSLVRVTTTASSLEAEKDSGGGPMCQETMRDTIAQTRIDAIDADEEISLVSVHDADVLDVEEVFVADKEVNDEVNVVEEVVEVINTAKLTVSAATTTTATITTVDDITLAQALMENKKEQNPRRNTSREKAKKEEEANIALIETWDDIQAKNDVEDDKEIEELKQLMKIIPDEEEVAIDAIPLAVKSPSIDISYHHPSSFSSARLQRSKTSFTYRAFDQEVESFLFAGLGEDVNPILYSVQHVSVPRLYSLLAPL
ncbi:hypothetical protein Tco_1106230 [Tanacetum coccineum]